MLQLHFGRGRGLRYREMGQERLRTAEVPRLGFIVGHNRAGGKADRGEQSFQEPEEHPVPREKHCRAAFVAQNSKLGAVAARGGFLGSLGVDFWLDAWGVCVQSRTTLTPCLLQLCEPATSDTASMLGIGEGEIAFPGCKILNMEARPIPVSVDVRSPDKRPRGYENKPVWGENVQSAFIRCSGEGAQPPPF